MPRTTLNGRLALDRAGIADRLGIHLSRVDAAIAAAPHNGFPPPTNGKWRYADDVDNWWRQHRHQQQQALTKIDYTGDPDDLVTKAEASRIIGYSSPVNLDNSSVWDTLLASNNPADNLTMPNGRPRLRWPRRTVWRAAETRSGRTGRPRETTRTIDRTGNPNDLVGAAEAARILGYKRPSGLPKALIARADIPGRPRRWKRQTLWTFHDQAQT
ncbi:hypothetical protein [Salinispora arenicola]|uniref:hypothetical protein n=1 Tax=Salinispora arenicola TaxID=168697 RepID=UPI0012F8F216|nr:hypothetical protein [Salinispora arenicola]